MDGQLDEMRQAAPPADTAPTNEEGTAKTTEAQPPPKGILPVAEALGHIGGALALSAVVARELP